MPQPHGKVVLNNFVGHRWFEVSYIRTVEQVLLSLATFWLLLPTNSRNAF